MSVTSDSPHLAALHARHERLKEELAEEMKALLPDAPRIIDLKKRKLKLKDEIAAVELRRAA